MTLSHPIEIAAVASQLRAQATRPLLIGITGSVAVGKTQFAKSLAAALAPDAATLSTDGFLFPNVVLAERQIILKKGFPESFDADAMLAVLVQLRTGSATVPVHSHASYDIDPALARRVGPAAFVIVEGLGLSGFADGRSARGALDVLIYLDADPADIEAWYLARFLGLWRAGADDPQSFYHRFAARPEAEIIALARHTWATINRPNLDNHIVHARGHADMVLHKTADHRLLWQRS